MSALSIAGLHLYPAAGPLAELSAGHVEWMHAWKGFGALAGAYVFAALASRLCLLRRVHDGGQS